MKDDIQPTDLSPWMGFVYTFPEHRGHHYVGLLMDEVERLAKREGVSEVYISTDHDRRIARAVVFDDEGKEDY